MPGSDEPTIQPAPTGDAAWYPVGEANGAAADPWAAPPSPAAEWADPGAYPTAPPRRRPLRWVVIGLLLVVLVAVSGVAITHAVWRAASGPGAGAGAAPGGGEPAVPGVPGEPAVPGPSDSQVSPPATGAPDVSAIAAVVDPAVVNIVSTLGVAQASAAGTGIVLTASGDVLTNNHVIEGATSVNATDVGNGRTYTARVVGYDRTHDLAVIHLDGAAGLRTAPIGDSSKVATGDGIVAIGNAGGRGGIPAAVSGTVTAVDQTITASDQNGANAQQLTGLIQVAADIQPGDSGGPLVDSSAHVIGVDTAATAGFRFQATGGDGFAIPINQAIAVARQIEAGQASSTVHIGATAFLGVQVVSAGRGRAGSGQTGAAVAAVVAGSPADQAGLARGDIIVSVDGAAVASPADLTNLLTSHHPGDRVAIGWEDASGQTRSVTLRLATGPAG